MQEPSRIAFAGGLQADVYAASGTETARVLCFHGGGGVSGDPSMLAEFCGHLAQAGDLGVAAAGYRTLDGDGATLDDMFADARSALDAMRSDLPEGMPLYLLGASFGGFLACHVALQSPDRVTGLILLNPVTDTGPEGFTNRVVATDRQDISPVLEWRNHPLTSRLRCGLFHGTDDAVVPIDASRRFAALWPDGRCQMTEYPRAGHGFFNRAPHAAEVAGQVGSFIRSEDRAGPARAGAAPPRGSPRHLPDGVSIIYGIGAQKAGTTWLHDYLAAHPSCHPPPAKELHYFDVIHDRREGSHVRDRLAWLRQDVEALGDPLTPDHDRALRKILHRAAHLRIYTGRTGEHRKYVEYLLRGHDDEPFVCDVTPSYSTLDSAAFADMDGVGPARFVFVMREPVSRFWSQFRMETAAKGLVADTGRFRDACIEHARRMHGSGHMRAARRGDYRRTIEALESAVARDRILYLFHEDPFPQATADSICDFLGVARHPIAEGDAGRSNVGRELDLPADVEELMVDALRPQYAFALERFGDAVPESWHRRFAERRQRPLPAAPPRRGPLSILKGRARAASDDPVVVFLHIPKTAGQTIFSEMQRVVGRAAVSPVRVHHQVAPDAQLPAGYRVHSGHIDWVDLRTLPENRFVFTVLRDPRERIASFYFYLLREAERLSAEQLAARENTGKRVILERSPDDYFFGGDKAWQTFIHDHYDNFYTNYLATRRIRGWKPVSKLSGDERLDRALDGAKDLDRIYHVGDLGPLEADLERVLGRPVRLTGNYKNAGPDAGGAKRRWGDLAALFEDPANARRLEDFARLDQGLMERLGVGPQAEAP